MRKIDYLEAEAHGVTTTHQGYDVTSRCSERIASFGPWIASGSAKSGWKITHRRTGLRATSGDTIGQAIMWLETVPSESLATAIIASPHIWEPGK